jgi:Flp pilus assembly protein TadG
VTAEFVIATPLLMFFVMLIIQAGLYFHATNVASAAAQEGALAATLEGDFDRIAAGEADAAAFIQEVAPRLLSNVDVQGVPVDGGEIIRITVDADVLPVFAFPGVNLDWSVHETSQRTVERFRPANEQAPSAS